MTRVATMTDIIEKIRRHVRAVDADTMRILRSGTVVLLNGSTATLRDADGKDAKTVDESRLLAVALDALGIKYEYAPLPPVVEPDARFDENDDERCDICMQGGLLFWFGDGGKSCHGCMPDGSVHPAPRG